MSFSLQIRDSLLGQVNSLLTRIGPRFGFSAQIRSEGFHTEAELDLLTQAIADGSMPFTEIVDRLHQLPVALTQPGLTPEEPSSPTTPGE